MTHDDANRWLQAYVDAWRSYDPAAIAALFTDDARYRYHPWDDPVEGRDAIVADWLGNKDDPGAWEASVRGMGGRGRPGRRDGDEPLRRRGRQAPLSQRVPHHLRYGGPVPGVHRDLRDPEDKRLAMRGGLRRHVVPLAVALATAILFVVPGASAAPAQARSSSRRPGGGRRSGARRRRRRRRLPPVRRHPDRGADRRDRRARLRRGRPRLPDRQRPAVPRLLRPDVGPLPLEDVAGRRQPRVRDRRRDAATSTTSASRGRRPGQGLVRLRPRHVADLRPQLQLRRSCAAGRVRRRSAGCGRTSRRTRRACVAAIWHHPLFSSGEHGSNAPVAAALAGR